MKKTIGVLCCIAVMSIRAPAQDILEVRKGPGRREFRQSVRDTFQYAGKNDLQLQPILNSYEPSAAIYHNSRTMKVMGRILTFGGVTGLMLSGGMEANRNRPIMPSVPGQLQLNLGTVSPEIIRNCLIGSLVGLSAGISMLMVSEKLLHRSVRMYNGRKTDGEPPGTEDRGVGLRLGLTPNGAGLTLNW